jgi:hypothetical protein
MRTNPSHGRSIPGVLDFGTAKIIHLNAGEKFDDVATCPIYLAGNLPARVGQFPYDDKAAHAASARRATTPHRFLLPKSHTQTSRSP